MKIVKTYFESRRFNSLYDCNKFIDNNAEMQKVFYFEPRYRYVSPSERVYCIALFPVDNLSLKIGFVG